MLPSWLDKIHLHAHICLDYVCVSVLSARSCWPLQSPCTSKPLRLILIKHADYACFLPGLTTHLYTCVRLQVVCVSELSAVISSHTCSCAKLHCRQSSSWETGLTLIPIHLHIRIHIHIQYIYIHIHMHVVYITVCCCV